MTSIIEIKRDDGTTLGKYKAPPGGKPVSEVLDSIFMKHGLVGVLVEDDSMDLTKSDLLTAGHTYRFQPSTNFPPLGEEGSRKRLKPSGIGVSVNAEELSELVKEIRLLRGSVEQGQQAVVKRLEVHGSLCALLKSSLSDLEVELPVLTVAGVEYEPIRFLGSGATSNVLCMKDEDAREYAAKIPRHGKNLENDYRMLACLKDVEGVPKALGWFDDDKSLRIYPVGERISHKSISSRWSLVPGLVDVLERAHKLGIINRDVRPDNIMIAKGKLEESEMLYILDWGFAVTRREPAYFSGGVMYASERILEQLAGGGDEVVADERDDTESLIHTIFALRYKRKYEFLRRLDHTDFVKIRGFWSECSDGYPGWQSAWTAARAGDYAKLKWELEKLVSNSCLS